jgi:carboxylesterase
MTTLIAMIRALWHKFFPPKPTIIAIHGFGVRRSVELAPLVAFFTARGYRVETPDLFDQTDASDTDPALWIERAESAVAQAVGRKERVWLVGFSMGGVIASQMAAVYPVERLVLLAPAFDYVSTRLVKLKAQEIVDDLLKRPKPDSNYPPLPESFNAVFREIIARCSTGIVSVSCPVLLMHGTEDEVIPVRSSEGAYAKIPHERKRLLILQGVQHRILDSVMGHDVLQIMQDFVEGKLSV